VRREVVVKRSPAKEVVVEETPIKAMTTSVFSVSKTPTVIPNPMKALGSLTKPLATSNVRFNLVSPSQIVQPQPSPKFGPAVGQAPQVTQMTQSFQAIPVPYFKKNPVPQAAPTFNASFDVKRNRVAEVNRQQIVI
jgi:hypothetical protein